MYIQSGDIGLIIPDETKLDKRFSYYLVSSSVVKKQLDARSQQTKIRHTSPEAINSFKSASSGSIVKFITKGDIENIPVFIPNDEHI